MIDAIPKVKLNDQASWVEADTIAISSAELSKYAKRLETHEYFLDKQILILSIIPDDFETDYYSILEDVFKGLHPQSRYILTSADCACYTDHPDWCVEELQWLIQENQDLLKKYTIPIGILKGYNAETYERIRAHLAPHVKRYLLYITGELRSNPRGFSLVKYLKTHFPKGLDKPVYLHGCSRKQMPTIPQLDLRIKGIITAGHIADAIYRGNPHYKRETRIQKNWKKWKQAIEGVKV